MLELFGQVLLANFQNLEVDFFESLEPQGSDDSNLEQASFYSFMNLMRLSCRTLVKATFNGLAKDEQEASVSRSFVRPTSFARLKELDITLHNNDAAVLEPFTTNHLFLFLRKLRISVALPEPEDGTFEKVCQKIASTSLSISNLTRTKSDKGITFHSC